MIPRYSRPEMTAIWAPKNRFRLWLEVEISVLEAMAALGHAPIDAATAVREKATARLEQIIDPERIDEIEEVTRHDVIAFLTHVEEVIGEEARFLHLGMTSSDLLDTSVRPAAGTSIGYPARRARPAAGRAQDARLRA